MSTVMTVLRQPLYVMEIDEDDTSPARSLWTKLSNLVEGSHQGNVIDCPGIQFIDQHPRPQCVVEQDRFQERYGLSKRHTSGN